MVLYKINKINNNLLKMECFENDNKLFENSIKYLHNISNIKGLNIPALKSFYSTKGRLMELRKAIYLPSHITRRSVRCQRCLINLSDGPASFSIKPQNKKSKFARKLLTKFHQDKPLTLFQRKYLKKLDEFNGNQLTITCHFCKMESYIKLEKPKKTVKKKATRESLQKKKKGKKKDKFCGLNVEAVKSLTPQNVRNLDDTHSENGSKKTGLKLSRKAKLKKTKVEVTKDTIKENTLKVMKKTKKIEKLNQVLSNSLIVQQSKTSTKLKNFLQTL